jgi:hypothetical protein
MSEPIPKCSNCQQEIPVGKYYEIRENEERGGKNIRNYCSPC